VSEVSEELEAFTSGIEKSLTADDGQHPPAGSFRFPLIRESEKDCQSVTRH
jgi:hypothetical protein